MIKKLTPILVLLLCIQSNVIFSMKKQKKRTDSKKNGNILELIYNEKNTYKTIKDEKYNRSYKPVRSYKLIKDNNFLYIVYNQPEYTGHLDDVEFVRSLVDRKAGKEYKYIEKFEFIKDIFLLITYYHGKPVLHNLKTQEEHSSVTRYQVHDITGCYPKD